MNRLALAFLGATVMTAAVFLAPSPEALAALSDELTAPAFEQATLVRAPSAACTAAGLTACCVRWRLDDKRTWLDPAAARAQGLGGREARGRQTVLVPCSATLSAIQQGCLESDSRPEAWTSPQWGDRPDCASSDGGSP